MFRGFKIVKEVENKKPKAPTVATQSHSTQKVLEGRLSECAFATCIVVLIVFEDLALVGAVPQTL